MLAGRVCRLGCIGSLLVFRNMGRLRTSFVDVQSNDPMEVVVRQALLCILRFDVGWIWFCRLARLAGVATSVETFAHLRGGKKKYTTDPR